MEIARRLGSRSFGIALALIAALFTPATALAQGEPGERANFGGDVIVRPGEVVRSVFVAGGNATIDGEVLEDVAVFGGDVVVNGRVHGDVVSMGGSTRVAPEAYVGGELTTMGGAADVAPGAATPRTVTEMGGHHEEGGLAGFVHQVLTSAASFAFLFLVGLLCMGIARERFQALQVVTVREPAHAFALGAVSFLGTIVAIVVLCITVIGIPAGIALILALWLACYLGLSVVASVVGVMLPVERLKDRPVMQLAAGTLVLFVTSLIPVVGFFALLIAGAIGLGAIVRTRLAPMPPLAPRSSDGEGAYRAAPYGESI